MSLLLMHTHTHTHAKALTESVENRRYSLFLRKAQLPALRITGNVWLISITFTKIKQKHPGQWKTTTNLPTNVTIPAQQATYFSVKLYFSAKLYKKTKLKTPNLLLACFFFRFFLYVTINECGVGIVHQATQEEVCGSFCACPVIQKIFFNQCFECHVRWHHSTENPDIGNWHQQQESVVLDWLAME